MGYYTQDFRKYNSGSDSRGAGKHLAFSPDDKLLASASCDRTVKLWDVARGQLLRTLGHAGEVTAMAFSPGGTLLVFGGYDNQCIYGACPVNPHKEKTVFKLFAKTIILIVLTALGTGCQPAAPTATADPPVPTAPPVSQPPTVTPAPPTDTLVPLAATPTRATRTPAPSIEVPATAAPTAVPTTKPAVATATPVSVAAIDQLIDTIADLGATGQFSGAVLIAKDGAPVYIAAYGLASRSPDVPNQTDTRFDLGSMNKMFTAVAILQLAEQGRLSLDGRISDYLPDYANQEVASKVTIHHLLVHTSGMGDCFEGDFFTTPKDQLRTVEGYLPLFVDDALQFEPGTQFAYSNEGYIVLGLIIEQVTGQSYWDYVRENVYRPSGMSRTDSYELDTEMPNRAIGYTTQDAQGNETGTLADNTPLMPIKGTPAGGGFSTVEDLLNFSNALLGYRLLSPESTELLLAGKIEVRQGSQYAYGFFDRMIGGQRVVGHGGGAPGVCTFMEMYLDSGYTVIVLSNTDQGCFRVLEFLREHPFAPSAAIPTDTSQNHRCSSCARSACGSVTGSWQA